MCKLDLFFVWIETIATSIHPFVLCSFQTGHEANDCRGLRRHECAGYVCSVLCRRGLRWPRDRLCLSPTDDLSPAAKNQIELPALEKTMECQPKCRYLSESNPQLRAFLQNKHKNSTVKIVDDCAVGTADAGDKVPGTDGLLDLYMAGPNCQPFSNMGNKQRPCR